VDAARFVGEILAHVFGAAHPFTRQPQPGGLLLGRAGGRGGLAGCAELAGLGALVARGHILAAQIQRGADGSL
jgi:hypothetical protein